MTDALTGETVGPTQAMHELLIQAAIQGQSVFSASGDSGGYEVDPDFGDCCPSRCNLPFTVVCPASDSAITAAGATTLAGVQEFCLNAGCTPPFYTVDIKHERVWGLDYLTGYCAAFSLDPISCGIFPWGMA